MPCSCSVLDLLVSLQVAGMGEAAVADGAAEGPLASVDVPVDIQLTLTHKALATHQAGVRLLPCVPRHVFLQVRLQEEALCASCAAKRPLHGRSVIKRELEVTGTVSFTGDRGIFLADRVWIGHRMLQHNVG